MRVLWTMLHKFDGKVVIDPNDYTQLELEYLLDFQNEFIDIQNKSLEEEMAKADSKVGEIKKTYNEQGEETAQMFDRLSMYKARLGMK